MKSDNENRNGRVEDVKSILELAGGVGKKTPEESIVQRSIAQLLWKQWQEKRRFSLCFGRKEVPLRRKDRTYK